MCGRYYRRSEKQEIAQRFKVGKITTQPFPANYNIAPSTFQPIIRQDRDTGDRELELLRWGLIPFFTKSLESFKGFTTINAKAEDIAEKPTWRGPFTKGRRCLVPVDGFYEWKKLPTLKKPYAFSMRRFGPFAFAGLWDAWHDPAKSKEYPSAWLQSYTIITTDANELMAPVHNRMPVILHEQDYDAWLNRDFGATPDQADALRAMLRPFEVSAMQSAPANQAVGNVRNNGPEMLNSA
jgi:putative SOS response-associated peptidase YedK